MAPLLLYEEWLLCLFLIPIGLWVSFREEIADTLHKLDARDLLLFLYLFHMLFGERNFAYVGFEPIFVTELTLGALLVAWRRELIDVRTHLMVYYLIVAIGLLWAVAYVGDYRISALRDSLMLVYTIWVPVLYLAFRKRRSYELFFLLLKLFIVLKAVAYVYEAGMIVTGNRSVLMEGFRFNVGYVVPSAIVISLFLPLRILDWRYKLLSFVMVPAIFTLFHRSIFLGLALAVGFFFWDGLPRVRKRILGYGTIAMILLGSFLVFYNARVDVDLYRVMEQKFSGDEGNISYRFLAWERTLESYLDNPILGAGVGRPVMYVQGDQFYDTINMDYFDIRDLGGNAQPHNSYLHILTRFGLVIVPLLFYALWLPARRILYLRKRDYGSSERYYRFLQVAGFYLVMLVFAFFNVVLESPHHAFPFWLSVAMVLAWGRSSNSLPKRVRLERRPSGGAEEGPQSIRLQNSNGPNRSGREDAR